MRKYKNSVQQEAGINKDMLEWIANEAKLKNIPPAGYDGGLIIDEMSIQPDLLFRKQNNDIKLIGFTECSPESIVFDQMKSNKREKKLSLLMICIWYFWVSQVFVSHLPIFHLILHQVKTLLTYWEVCEHAFIIWVQNSIFQYWWCPKQS